jgi:hypothetical protein
MRPGRWRFASHHAAGAGAPRAGIHRFDKVIEETYCNHRRATSWRKYFKHLGELRFFSPCRLEVAGSAFLKISYRVFFLSAIEP